MIDCTKCGKPCNLGFTCRQDVDVTMYCADCFAVTPCGLGLHKDGCMIVSLGMSQYKGCRDYTNGTALGQTSPPEILTKAVCSLVREHTTHVMKIFVGRDRIQGIIGGLFELRLRLDHNQSAWSRYAGTLSNRRTSPDELRVKLADGREIRFVIEENN